MPDIRKLRDLIRPSKTNRGDGMCIFLSLPNTMLALVLTIESYLLDNRGN